MTRRKKPGKVAECKAPPPSMQADPSAPPLMPPPQQVASTTARAPSTSNSSRQRVPLRTSRGYAFALDPLRMPPLEVSRRDIEAMDGKNWLSTTLMDYIIQQGFPKEQIPDDFIIGSCESFTFFETMNQKDLNSPDRNQVRTAKALRRNYEQFSNRGYKFIALNCTEDHFFVVSVRFDIHSSHSIFTDVFVFDSLRRSDRGKDGGGLDAVLSTSIPGRMLRHLQLFLSKFSFLKGIGGGPRCWYIAASVFISGRLGAGAIVTKKRILSLLF